MMKKAGPWLRYSVLSILFTTLVFGQGRSYRPKDGFVPDEKTAIRVAEAVLTPIYGEQQIIAERPFSTKLHDGVWVVMGHLPDGLDGGVAEVRISKRTGEILYVMHGK